LAASVLVLIGVSIGSSGKTTTNTAATKPAPGVTGVAGDGKTIICEDNDGWRCEPV
jgi:hypothetical protein